MNKEIIEVKGVEGYKRNFIYEIEKGNCFLIKYEAIYKLSLNNNKIKAVEVLRKDKNSKIGIAGRGRFHLWNERETSRLIEAINN